MKQIDTGLPAQPRRYSGINGLRAFSAIGIILMHVLANGGYALNSQIANRLILSFTDLVFLFMLISGFSMCCGYYDKFVNNRIDLGKFYGKRFQKIWPYFAMLCLLDVVIAPSRESLYEAFANLTMMFGLLPDPNLSVIGVGWFLGLVFVFYMVFPFFCYLLSDRRRAWFSFAVALVLSKVCEVYFDVGRVNLLYSGVFFLGGGLVFLYREQILVAACKFRWLLLLGCAAAAACYYALGASVPVMLVACVLLLAVAMGAKEKGILSNRVTEFLSNISLELYLGHMVIYRVLEKLNLLKLFGNGVVSYLVAAVATVVGTVVFAVVATWALGKAQQWLQKIPCCKPNKEKGE